MVVRVAQRKISAAYRDARMSVVQCHVLIYHRGCAAKPFLVSRVRSSRIVVAKLCSALETNHPSCITRQNFHCQYTIMDDISPAPVDLPVANEVENVEINKILYGVIDRVHGLSAILISTGDGVPLVQVARDPESVSPADLAYFQTQLATTYATASKQIASLKLGAVKSIISEYTHFTIVHIDGGQLVITLVAEKDANIALIQLLGPDLKKALSLFGDQVSY